MHCLEFDYQFYYLAVEQMVNFILLLGTFFGLTSIGMGAYVDHVMGHAADTKASAMVYTALHYHGLYAIVITVIGLVIPERKNTKFLKLSAWTFIIGTGLFSFSIYLASITCNQGFVKVTPVGGTLLMVGWAILGCSAFNRIH